MRLPGHLLPAITDFFITVALIGNLTLEAAQSEEYSDQNARRDLMLLGETLRNLPRLAEALDQNRCTANYVLKQRREVFK